MDPYDQIAALAALDDDPIIVSTFSGYGGLDLGVEAATGARTVAHVEFDEKPSRILAHHWPDVPNLGDVTAVDWRRMPHGHRVILTTGFPCQDVSLAGLRLGLKAGTRSGLWSEVAKAIEEIRPGLVVIENVRGLLSAEATSPVEPDAWDLGDGQHRPTLRALGAVLGDLADLGYDARWCGLRAADAGAPHGRFRVFVIAYPAGWPWRPGAADAYRGGLGVLGRLGAGERDAHGRGGADGDGVAAEPSARLLPTPMTSDMRGVGVHGQGGNDLRTEIALLKTPTAQLASNGGSQHPDKRKAGGHGPTLADEIEHLIPTPTAGDGKGGRRFGHDGRQLGKRSNPSLSDLPNILNGALLPTPTVGNATGGNASRSGDRSDELLLPGLAVAVTDGTLTGLPGLAERGYLGDEPLLPTPSAATRNDRETPEEWQERHDFHAAKADAPTRSGLPIEILAQSLERASSWGPFAVAIDRWERVTGRAAPPPTNPDGKGGAHRLAPQFSEWMMGLPPGHVTAPEIWHGMKPSAARTAQLKAIGNGVVPQHAALAVRSLVAAEWAELRGGEA